MMKMDKKIAVKIVISLLLMAISYFGVAKYASSPEFHAKTIKELDEKKTTVMELTAASTAASVTVSMLPGDMGSSISDKLMDLSGYFLIVLSALYLEKYLVTIIGFATFKWLLPGALILFIVSLFWNREVLKRIAVRVALFGMAIFLVIPTSMNISRVIEKTYESSIEETLKAAKETTQEIEDTAKENEGVVKQFISKIKGGFSAIVKKMENALNNFVEALAVMIVTSCVIPILVMLFFVWLVKILLGVNLNVTGAKIPRLSQHVNKHKGNE